MKRIPIILLAFILAIHPACADRFTDMAQNISGWLRAGLADSILSHSSPQIRAILTPQMVRGLWPQLLAQCGGLQYEQEWTQSVAQGYEVRQKLLVFERTALRLNVVFNEKTIMEGINFIPAQRPERKDGGCVEKTDTTAFTERAFVVRNGKIELPGTLTLPAGRMENLPVVVLVHGSGPQDRDETAGPNKIFRDLAHALAKKGIAVARYDKRTYVYQHNMAEAGGGNLTWRTETADDAAEAMNVVSRMPEVDSRRVFVLGHSQGGTCLPLIVDAAEVRPAGLIAMAALARPFWQAVHEQLSHVCAGNGSIIALAEGQMRGSLPKEYMNFIETYKPLEEMAKLKEMPCLFLQGGHDYQVTEADLSLWRDALKENKKAEFRLFPSLDHFFRHLPEMTTPSDYAQAIPLSEEAVEAIAAFILKN